MYTNIFNSKALKNIPKIGEIHHLATLALSTGLTGSDCFDVAVDDAVELAAAGRVARVRREPSSVEDNRARLPEMLALEEVFN
jgi:hypothetical protein